MVILAETSLLGKKLKTKMFLFKNKVCYNCYRGYMELVKSHWDKKDIPEFQKYLLSLGKGEEKGEWEKRIVGTSLPCIAVPSKTVENIVKEIAKGNFLEFVDLWPWENFTNTIIVGKLICKTKDFEAMKKYLLKYSQKVDNWASIDSLKIKTKDKNNYFEFAKTLCSSPHTFSRRLGVIMLFKELNEKQMPETFEIMNSFEKESEYYVNMALAWLFCECFIKQREKTLEYLKANKLSKFVINKGISKCRDSYRVSKEDKELLLRYKK